MLICGVKVQVNFTFERLRSILSKTSYGLFFNKSVLYLTKKKGYISIIIPKGIENRHCHELYLPFTVPNNISVGEIN